MIWFTVAYSGGTVDLLEKNEADHLVREGHAGEGESIAGRFPDTGCDTKRTTYQKRNRGVSFKDP